MEKLEEARCHAPNKSYYNRELSECMDIIGKLQHDLKLLKSKIGRINEMLRTVRAERNEANAEKMAIEAKIKGMSAGINKLVETQSRLKPKIHCRDGRKVDDAIKKLQTSLQNKHFRLSEEKRIVAEIDSLTRSKKIVVQYNEVNEELSEQKRIQRSERERRDCCMRHITAKRTEESNLNAQHNELKVKEMSLNRELDIHHERKRRLKEEFKEKQLRYEQYMAARSQQREALRIQKKEQTNSILRDALESALEPYAKQRELCNLLTQYLQGMLPQDSTATAASESLIDSLTQRCEILVTEEKTSKQKTKKKEKRLAHNAEIFSQFLQLDLTPPGSPSQLQASLSSLRAKQRHYEELARKGSRPPRPALTISREVSSDEGYGDSLNSPVVLHDTAADNDDVINSCYNATAENGKGTNEDKTVIDNELLKSNLTPVTESIMDNTENGINRNAIYSPV